MLWEIEYHPSRILLSFSSFSATEEVLAKLSGEIVSVKTSSLLLLDWLSLSSVCIQMSPHEAIYVATDSLSLLLCFFHHQGPHLLEPHK